MSQWVTVIGACVLAFAAKYAGYRVPAHWLSHPTVARMVSLMPIALLSALVVTQAFVTQHGDPTLDARALGVAVAVAALLARAPFLVVIVLAGAAAALARARGWA